MDITIAIVTYNAASCLEDCLRSVLDQAPHGGQTEILVIDGCSTDGTQDIARSFGERVRLVENPGRTIASNRNVALREARYEALAFTDADCVVSPDWLARLSAGFKGRMADDDHVAGVGGCNRPPEYQDDFQAALGVARNSNLGCSGSVQGRIHEKEEKVSSLGCFCVLYSKAALQAVGGFDESLENMCEDADINFRLCRQGWSLYVIPGIVVEHRSRSGLLSWWQNMVAYGVGRGRLMRKHRSLFSWVYFPPLMLLPLLLAGTSLGFVWPWAFAAWLYVPLMLLAGCALALRAGNRLGLLVGVILLGTQLGYALGLWRGLVKKRLWLPLILIVVAMAAYANSFHGVFLLDDYHTIVANPTVTRLWDYDSTTRAVAESTFKMNYAIGGLNVVGYHVTNLLIHTLAGLLLFGVIRRTALMPRMKARFGGVSVWLAGSCALIWVVHPLQTESVTYICQRYESLMGLFFLLALYGFIRGIGSPHSRGWHGLSLGACLLGMAVKPVMAGAPLLIWLYDGLFVSKTWRETWLARGKVHLVLFLTWGILAVLRMAEVGSGYPHALQVVPSVSAWRYLLTQSEVIMHYLGLSVYPASLCLAYDYPFVDGLREVLLPMIVLCGVAGLVLWGVIRRRPVAYLGAWFFIILAPSSSVVPLYDAAAEHRMYLPLASIIAAIVFGAASLGIRLGVQGRAGRWSVCLALISVLGILVGLTRSRNLDYLSREGMWRDVMKKSSGNLRAYGNVATALLARQDYLGAARAAEGLLKEAPPFAAMSDEQIRNGAGGLEDVNHRFDPLYYAKARNVLGIVALEQGQREEAEAHLREAIRVWPSLLESYANMALVFLRGGDEAKAIRWWQDILTLSPGHVGALRNLAQLYERNGEYPTALKYYRELLRVMPGGSDVSARIRMLEGAVGRKKTALPQG